MIRILIAGLALLALAGVANAQEVKVGDTGLRIATEGTYWYPRVTNTTPVANPVGKAFSEGSRCRAESAEFEVVAVNPSLDAVLAKLTKVGPMKSAGDACVPTIEVVMRVDEAREMIRQLRVRNWTKEQRRPKS